MESKINKQNQISKKMPLNFEEICNRFAVLLNILPLNPFITMKFTIWILWLCSLTFAWAGTGPNRAQTGMASYYANQFHGRRTSNGERFNMYAYTAAHRTHPFNTMLKVTNLANGKSVIVRVNDRGPHARKRILDLSKRAAADIDLIRHGSAKVRVEVVGADGKITSKDPKKDKKSTPTPNVIKASPKPKGILVANPSGSNGSFGTGKTFSLWGTEKEPMGFGIQIGSYDNLETAKADCKAVINKGVSDAYIQVGWAKGTKTYRVVLGEYARREHAEADLDKYKKLGYDGFVKKHL